MTRRFPAFATLCLLTATACSDGPQEASTDGGTDTEQGSDDSASTTAVSGTGVPGTSTSGSADEAGETSSTGSADEGGEVGTTTASSSGASASESTTGAVDESGDDTGDAETSSSDDGSSSSTGDDGGTPGWGGFPAGPAFGDDVVEPELVGTWSLSWDPAGVADQILTVAADGSFEWRETSADCATDTVGTGWLWVEQTFLVFHVSSWERALPWDTETDIGESFPAPFRMKLSYTLFGDSLSILGPAGLGEELVYDGRAYVRQTTAGSYLGGTWNGQAILEAIPAGATEPEVVLIHDYSAYLDAESGADAEGTGTIGVTKYYYYPTVQNLYAYENGNWQDLSPGNPSGGQALMTGSRAMLYGPSFYGTVQMATAASGQTFKRGIDTDCP